MIITSSATNSFELPDFLKMGWPARRLVIEGYADLYSVWELPAIEILDMNMTVDLVNKYKAQNGS